MRPSATWTRPVPRSSPRASDSSGGSPSPRMLVAADRDPRSGRAPAAVHGRPAPTFRPDYGRLAAAATRPLVPSLGPPVWLTRAPADDAAAWPRAASFGPPVRVTGDSARLLSMLS